MKRFLLIMVKFLLTITTLKAQETEFFEFKNCEYFNLKTSAQEQDVINLEKECITLAENFIVDDNFIINIVDIWKVRQFLLLQDSKSQTSDLLECLLSSNSQANIYYDVKLSNEANNAAKKLGFSITEAQKTDEFDLLIETSSEIQVCWDLIFENIGTKRFGKTEDLPFLKGEVEASRAYIGKTSADILWFSEYAVITAKTKDPKLVFSQIPSTVFTKSSQRAVLELPKTEIHNSINISPFMKEISHNLFHKNNEAYLVNFRQQGSFKTDEYGFYAATKTEASAVSPVYPTPTRKIILNDSFVWVICKKITTSNGSHYLFPIVFAYRK